ncbi:melanocyte-stimulating hormone receptor-like [Dendronephthya gigantea]|uniref:melanocyte-stimulating hormone receptor-like n=1 Tax=Dendronephthya gigantea TaxID=151771 RepID=UPI0010696285|nr:melanocyte-stimulating hormone receptor-like [Dendronephthya gigantea]
MMDEEMNASIFIRCDGLYITYYSRYPSEGIYRSIDLLVIVTNILLSVIGSIANGAIIAAYYRNKRLRNEHNMLLCVLACTDIIVTAILQPLFVITKFGNLLASFDSCVLWNINSLVSYVCLCVSMLCLVLISMERFAVLYYACRYKTIVTHRRIKVGVCCSWLLVLLVACLHITVRVHQVTFMFYAILSLFSIVICVYLGVYTEKLLRHHRKSIKHNQGVTMNRNQIKAQKKTVLLTRTAYFIGGTLLACYLPGIVMLVYEGVKYSTDPDFYFIVRPCIITLMYVNSALDPCLVLWRNREIRETAAHVFDRTRWGGSNSSM